MDKQLSKKQRKKLKLQQKLAQKQKQQKLLSKIKKSQQQTNQIVQANTKQKEIKKSQDNILTKSKGHQISKKQLKHKKLKQQPEQEDESQQNAEDENDGLNFNNVLPGQQNIQVSFLISEINQKQYHSMKIILQKFSKNTNIMSSEWADAIISNLKGGNAVLADEDEEQEQEEQQGDESQDKEQQEDDEENVCSGIINILPSTNKLVKRLIQKIVKSLQAKKINFVGNKNPAQVVKNKCSLLICERAINIPAFVVKSMHEVLVNDLKQLRKTDNQLYTKICGQYILGISEVQLEGSSKGGVTVNIDEIIYSRFQDYLFLKKSVCWWVGQVSPNSVKKMPLHKLYFVISSKQYFTAVTQIQTLIEE